MTRRFSGSAVPKLRPGLLVACYTAGLRARAWMTVTPDPQPDRRLCKADLHGYIGWAQGGLLERWNVGRLARLNVGRLARLNVGRLARLNVGRLARYEGSRCKAVFHTRLGGRAKLGSVFSARRKGQIPRLRSG